MISLVETRARIEAGTLSPQAAIDAAMSAIQDRDPEIGAFVRIAEGAKAGTGPLAGIAVGVKDIFDTADFATEMGSPIYGGWRPKADAPIVAELKRLGATVAGKTVTTPFASMDPAGTCNPCNRGHTPGGSSSGSAAAVAAGMVHLALGTQTGGSVIRPASYCGVAAIKPSFRLLPTVGVKCFAWSLDTVGLFAAGVADVAHALALLTGRPDLAGPVAGEVADAPRIGVLTQDFAGAPEPEGARALEAAIAAAERAGATVRELAAPAEFGAMWRLHPTLQAYEAARSLSWEIMTYANLLPPKVKSELEQGRMVSTRLYDDARSAAVAARAAAGTLFAEVDVLLSLSATGPAPASLASTGDPRFNRLWTDLGTPCVNVPAYLALGNLPVGVQVIAPYGQDGRALAAARFLEKALGRVMP